MEELKNVVSLYQIILMLLPVHQEYSNNKISTL